MEQKKGMYIYKKNLNIATTVADFFFHFATTWTVDWHMPVAGVRCPTVHQNQMPSCQWSCRVRPWSWPGPVLLQNSSNFQNLLEKFMTNVNGTTGLFIIISVSANRLFFTTDSNQNTSSMLSTVGRSRRTRLRMDSSHWQALGIRGEYITIGLAMVVLISVSSSLLN